MPAQASSDGRQSLRLTVLQRRVRPPPAHFPFNKTPLHVVPTGGPRRPASGPQGAREARGSRPHPHLPPSPVHVVVAVQVQDAAGHLAGHALQGDGVGGQGLRCPAAPQVALEVPLPTGAAASPAGGEWAPCRPTPQPFLPRANWGSCQAPRGGRCVTPGDWLCRVTSRQGRCLHTAHRPRQPPGAGDQRVTASSRGSPAVLGTPHGQGCGQEAAPGPACSSDLMVGGSAPGWSCVCRKGPWRRGRHSGSGRWCGTGPPRPHFMRECEAHRVGTRAAWLSKVLSAWRLGPNPPSTEARGRRRARQRATHHGAGLHDQQVGRHLGTLGQALEQVAVL